MFVWRSRASLVCSVAMPEAMIALTPSWMGAFLIAVTCVLPDGHRTHRRSAPVSAGAVNGRSSRRKVPLTKNIG
jgi:hypothetical protein